MYNLSNSHSLHAEDVMVEYGRSGLENVEAALKEAATTPKVMSIKWDGAPAVVFGTHPVTEQFFVSTKGFFNKKSVAYFSEDEIPTDKPELAEILKLCFRLQESTPKGRYFMGDVLFAGDLDFQIIEGEGHWLAHPNTIVYGVGVDTELGKKWGTSKLGIAIHTEHSLAGRRLTVNLDEFQETEEIWLCDIKIHDKVMMEAVDIKLDSSDVWDLTFHEMQKCKEIFKKYMNTFIRESQDYDANFKAHNFKEYIFEQYQIKAAKLKSPVGKRLCEQRGHDIIGRLPPSGQLELFIELYHQIQEIKANIVTLPPTGIKCYLKTYLGLEETNHEGYVITTGALSGVKLVNRTEFSQANFSNRYIKGWDHRRKDVT